MAIDDNKTYGLTGAQVKDLAQRINESDKSVVDYFIGNDLYSIWEGGGGDTVPFIIYADSSLTTAATLDDFWNDVQSNQVRLVYSNGSGSGSWSAYYIFMFYEDSAVYGSKSDTYFCAINNYSGIVFNVNWETGWTNPRVGIYSELQKKLTAGSNITIAGTTISATDTTYSDFTGATSSIAGAHGLVPAPAVGDQEKVLHGDGTWKDAAAKLVEMSYGEANAWAKFIAAYNAGSIVYCRASSNANPGTGSQTRKAFMAYVNNATSPTSVEFQYVRSVSSKSASQPVDQVFVYTLTNSNGGTWSVATRDMAPKLAAGTNTTVNYSSGTYTVSATDTTYSNMTGATSGTAGAAGLVPAPAAGDQNKILKGDGTWSDEQGELIFSYTQDSDASGNVSIDVPLDWSKYNIIHIYGAHQQSSSASSGWMTNYLLDENKNAAKTMMFGNEIDGDGNWHGVYREKSDGEVVSCGTASGTQIWVDATLMKIVGDYAIGYNANACGGTRAQDIMGRSWLSSGDAYPSYFRVTFNYPKAGGWVRVYGHK